MPAPSVPLGVESIDENLCWGKVLTTSNMSCAQAGADGPAGTDLRSGRENNASQLCNVSGDATQSHYIQDPIPGRKDQWRCGISDGKDYGTSHLRRHRGRCTKIRHDDIGQIVMDKEGKLMSRKIDQMVVHDMLASAIIEQDLPFKFVEFKKIRCLINYLNPDSIPVARNTAKIDVMRIYMIEKDKLKKEMSSIPTRISLTSDLWTACTTEGYVCLTAHYVDSNWKLRSKIINFCHMPPPHTGSELSKKILEFLNEWGIDKKIFSLTLDNASSNDVMQEQLKNKLIVENSLLCDGQFFHVRCSAHILNLIVQECLKVASDTLYKIRESIKYVRGSEGRMLKFKVCIAKIGGVDASVGLCLDVPTRWNSTYFMLESAIKYKHVFEKLHMYDDNYRFSPSVEEWKRAEKIHVFLLPFYRTTNLISGTSYPTSNLYFMQVWKIQCVLLDTLRDEDEVLRSMANRMVKKFEKYWDDYSVVLAMGAILDPRVKLETLNYCFERVDDSTFETKLQLVKRKLYMLFEQYRNTIAPTSMQTLTSDAPQKKAKVQDLDYLFDNYAIIYGYTPG
ncbi:PREDICTED: zinc finger BED domain-containing protein RICESLEEPER 2-like [Lupinus angustifolius]|uniref:zinc finger BED domain-containing protein RICESLEEPER 2-like n=1 Tax=Lupinus angustifolius TaxID=3871 RepID=UPI00092F436F|nr:PREDICTED: zinc finger BED domain-containing protein RICESLEEPER 2-like [Lupinus angustifolius]